MTEEIASVECKRHVRYEEKKTSIVFQVLLIDPDGCERILLCVNKVAEALYTRPEIDNFLHQQRAESSDDSPILATSVKVV